MTFPTHLPAGRRARPAAILFLARIVYAFNWYNLGAVLPLIGSGFGVGPAQQGIILGTFLVGVGLFQVPAGLASVRFGARTVALVGLTVMGVTGVAAAFSPSWEVLAAIRGVDGVGASLFFSPALALIASYFPPGEQGPVIGFYNGGFSVGGAIGLVGGAILGVAYGWPTALAFGGASLLAMTAVAFAFLPNPPPAAAPASPADLARRARRVLTSRSIWTLSLGLTGFWAAVFVVAQDFVNYAATDHPAWGIGASAAVTAGFVLASFPGGPAGGWLAERSRDRRRLVVIFSLATAVTVGLIPILPLGALVPDLIALGFLDGMVFAVLYLVPTYLPESEGEGLALGVGVVNSIQVSVGSVVAVAFGYIAAAEGYAAAWWFAAILTVAMLPILAGVTEGVGRAP